MLYAAAKFLRGNITCYSPPNDTIDQYGLIYIATDMEDAVKYAKEHREEFLECNGNYFPMLICFDPEKCKRTMEYAKTSPRLHIAAYEDRDYLSSCTLGHIPT